LEWKHFSCASIRTGQARTDDCLEVALEQDVASTVASISWASPDADLGEMGITASTIAGPQLSFWLVVQFELEPSG